MAATGSTMVPLGTGAPPFDLPDVVGGGRVSDADFAGAPALVVMFLCNHCPYVRHVRSVLARRCRELQERGVAVVGIMSNDVDEYPDDHPDRLRAEAAEVGYTFPYLYDESQQVALAYGAVCTPDFFVFDADRRLVYRGQMDGSRPSNQVPVTGDDLAAAVDAVLSGAVVPSEQRPSLGCGIKWKPGNEPG